MDSKKDGIPNSPSGLVVKLVRSVVSDFGTFEWLFLGRGGKMEKIGGFLGSEKHAGSSKRTYQMNILEENEAL